MFVLIYVDDLITRWSDPAQTTRIIEHPQSLFFVKDLKTLSYFLGVEVAKCKEGSFFPNISTRSSSCIVITWMVPNPYQLQSLIVCQPSLPLHLIRGSTDDHWRLTISHIEHAWHCLHCKFPSPIHVSANQAASTFGETSISLPKGYSSSWSSPSSIIWPIHYNIFWLGLWGKLGWWQIHICLCHLPRP